MEQILNEIPVSYPDAAINGILASIPESARDVSCSVRYNHNEELFLGLGTSVLMPHFPIHHDIREDEPSAEYASAIRDLAGRLSELLPDVFRGLTYFFDPTEPLKPRFYRLYKVEDAIYLFLLRLDLVFRHFQGEVVEPGTNDVTPAYRTGRLYIESELIPLEGIQWDRGAPRSFKVRQLVSDTWIGETGRGYLQHGIWMDNDLTKFFTKLVLPEGVRVYPYYPLFCKYKTVCAQAAPPSPDRRKRLLPLLHRSIGFLTPEMGRIQASLKAKPFSDSLPEFVDLRGRVPPSWREVLSGIAVKSYLNDRELKEYALEHQTFSA
jgi:hypothetical protein